MTALRTTNWDAVITSSPLDKQASIVRDGRGSGVEVTIENSFTEQPPVRDFRDFFGKPEDDLRDQRFNYLTVLGLAEKRKNWVCKCDCGRFAHFTTKGLRALAERNRAKCGECDYLERLRNGEIPSDAQRLILRNEKQARANDLAAFDAAAHPHFDKLMKEFATDGVDERTALSSFSRWLQRRVRALSDNDPSKAPGVSE